MKTISKTIVFISLIIGILCFWNSQTVAYLAGQEAHEKMLYPVVRVNDGGSGSLIYSKSNGEGKFSTYVLTNYHVIANAITIEEQWDPSFKKKIEVEKRKVVSVERFLYKENDSTPIGAFKIEALIILYNRDEDLALLKLSSEDQVPYVIEFCPREKLRTLIVFDQTVAVGCSLGWPPVPSFGILTRKNMLIDSYPYHMSQSQIIYGNSGGAMFNGDGQLIGTPSKVPALGWSGNDPVPHMGLFIPLDRVYDWLKKEHYDFLYDETKTEEECLRERKEELEAKKHE